MAYTSEYVVKVFDDKSGEHIYIGPDADALDLVELRSVSIDNEIRHRIVMEKEQAILVAQAILHLYLYNEPQKD